MSQGIEISVKETGSQQVKSSFDQIAKSAENTQKKVDSLTKSLKSFGVGSGANRALNSLSEASVRATANLKSLRAAISPVTTALNALARSSTTSAAAVGVLSANSKAAVGTVAGLQRGVQSAATATQAMSTAARATRDEIRSLGERAAGTAKSVKTAGESITQLSGRMQTLGSRTKLTSDQLKEFSSSTTGARQRVQNLAAANQATGASFTTLSSGMRSVNTGAGNVTSGLKSVNTELAKTGGIAATTEIGFRKLSTAFIGFMAVKGVINSLVETQVTMQGIHYGLLAAAGSAEGAAQQMEFLRKNAQTLGLDLKTSAMEYTRLAASANAMNVSMKDQQRLYVGLSRASTVLHLDAQKVQFATLALTQMFSKSKIQAEELRRQLGEAIPGVVPRFQRAVEQVIKGTDLAKYSFEDLMKRGLLNTKQFLPQLQQALEETGRAWEAASKSLNSEINRLKTAWFELKNEVSQGLFNTVLTAGVRWLATNLKDLTNIVIALGIAITVALAPAAIIQFIGYVRVLGLAVWAAAGPWGLLAGAILGVGAYLYSIKDTNEIVGKSINATAIVAKHLWKELGGVFKQMGRDIADYGSEVQDFYSTSEKAAKTSTENQVSLWDKALAIIIGLITLKIKGILFLVDTIIMVTRLAVTAAIGALVKLVMNTVKLIKGLAATALALMSGSFSMIGEIWGETFTGMVGDWKHLWETLDDITDYHLNHGFRAAFSRSIDGIYKELSLPTPLQEGSPLGANELSMEDYMGRTIELPQNEIERFLDTARKANKTVDEIRAMFDTIKNSGDPLGELRKTIDYLNGVSAPAAIDPKVAAKAAKEYEKVRHELDAVVASINKVESVNSKRFRTENALNAALKKGIITQEEAARIMGDWTEANKAILQPVETYIERLHEQQSLLGKYGDELKIEQEILKTTTEWRKQGIDLQTVNIDQLREELTLQSELNRIQSEKERIYAATVGKQQGDKDKLTAISQMRDEGVINEGQAAGQVMDIFGQNNMEGTAEYYANIQQIYQDHLNLIGEAEEQGLISSQTRHGLEAKAWADMQAAKLKSTEQFLGSLSGLMTSSNKHAFAVGKAAAIGEAIVKTYLAANSAYAAMAGIPIIGPALGAAAAAAAVVAGIANVQKIKSQKPPQYRTGGSMIVGGSGGTDSQLVQFMATPGERVHINTPAQDRNLRRRNEESNKEINVTAVFNLSSEQTVDDFRLAKREIEINLARTLESVDYG